MAQGLLYPERSERCQVLCAICAAATSPTFFIERHFSWPTKASAEGSKPKIKLACAGAFFCLPRNFKKLRKQTHDGFIIIIVIIFIIWGSVRPLSLAYHFFCVPPFVCPFGSFHTLFDRAVNNLRKQTKNQKTEKTEKPKNQSNNNCVAYVTLRKAIQKVSVNHLSYTNKPHKRK